MASRSPGGTLDSGGNWRSRHHDRRCGPRPISLEFGSHCFDRGGVDLDHSSNQVKMAAPAVMAAIGVAGGILGSCAPSPPPVPPQTAQSFAVVSETLIPANDLDYVRTTCAKYSGLLNFAANSGSSISGYAVDLAAYCNQIGAAPQGTVPASSNSKTSKWLNIGITALMVAAEAAKIVLPLL